jgi:hypothetical protein
MMKHFFFTTLLVCTALCGFAQEIFEGVITYTVTYQPKTTIARYNDIQANKYGNKMIVYYSKSGDFKREYLGTGPKGYSYVIYKSKTNKSYTKYRNSDTIFVHDCGKYALVFKKDSVGSEQKMLGVNCKSYSISAAELSGGQPIEMTWIYPASKERLNALLLLDLHEGFFDKYISKAKAPYYRYREELSKHILTYDIQKAAKKKLDKSIFAIPAGAPLKEK